MISLVEFEEVASLVADEEARKFDAELQVFMVWQRDDQNGH